MLSAVDAFTMKAAMGLGANAINDTAGFSI